MSTLAKNEAINYLESYKNTGRGILVKASGELIQQKSFQLVVDEIKRLLDFHIPVTLVVGGWSQITEQWKNAWKGERPKGLNGINKTTRELIQLAVQPAYENIIGEISQFFTGDRPIIIQPEQLMCNLIPRAGYVWNPYKIKGLNMEGGLNIVAFLWVADNSLFGGWKEAVNVNADDIVLWIAREFRTKLAAALFLTGVGGLLDDNHEILDFLTRYQLEKIIRWKLPNISVNWWMLKKIEVAQEVLAHLKKLAIVNPSNMQKELESHQWGGTLIVDVNRNRFEDMQHRAIFETVYNENVKKGFFAERTEIERDWVFKNHKVCVVDWTIIWGFSISDKVVNNEDGKLIECFWVAKKQASISSQLLKHISISNKPIFAYANGEVFQKYGFQEVAWVFSEKTGAKLWRWNPE